MQKRSVLLGILIFTVSMLQGQIKSGTISGTIMDQFGAPVPKATLYIGEHAKAISNAQGKYEITGLTSGTYRIRVECLGYQKVSEQVVLSPDQTRVSLDLQLQTSFITMEEVGVTGRSETEKVARQAFHVTAVDARKLHNSSLDLAQALDQVSGVRVRESGGVGSRFNFSLNGFSGKQVKFFLDGVPMENFGSAFQINNIPINIADRIEVYKGVVPITLGGDALGGAVNIITNPNKKNYLGVSYSYGSFNTHKTAINAGYTSPSGFTAQLSAFQNYSDNNYRVWVDVLEDFNTGRTEARWVRRFHDTYHNETLIASAGVVDKTFADRLLVGVTLGKVYADIQTGNRMFDVYGDRFRDGNIVMPTLKYSKQDLLVEGLDLRLNAHINLGENRSVDTVFKQYSWSGVGRYKTPDDSWAAGGERSRTLYTFRNNNSSVNANLSYRLDERQTLVLNGSYSGFDRQGEDRITPEDETAKQPQQVNKTILGLGYQYRIADRWEASGFFKQYFQDNSSTYVIEWTHYPRHSNFKGTGYGAAISYFIIPDFQLKASYEKSYRLPEGEELFGDVVNISPNTTLEPEKSDNINAGFQYALRPHPDHFMALRGNYIYRNASGFIRPVVSTVGYAEFKYANLRDVRNHGVEGELRYGYKQWLNASVNLTYQNLRNQTKYEGSSTTISPVYKDRIPNMPYLFGNADLSARIADLGAKGNDFTLGYHLQYVHEFYLRWPSQGDIKTGIIPEQWAHDVYLMYAMHNGRYNLMLECRNLSDNLLFDNYRLQKPGRSFSIKLRYFLSKQS